MRVWQCVAVVVVMAAACDAFLYPEPVAALVQMFPQLNLLSYSKRAGLAIAGFSLLKAALVIEAMDLARRSELSDQQEYDEFIAAVEAEYYDDDDEVEEQTTYAPTRRNSYPSPEDMFGPPKYRLRPPAPSYAAPVNYYTYGPVVRRRRTRAIQPEVAQAQELLMSAVTHLDTDGCVLKFLCHLNSKTQENRTMEENVLVELFHNSPEALGSYSAVVLEPPPAEASQQRSQDTCEEVTLRCPLGVEELGGLLQQTSGCTSTTSV